MALTRITGTVGDSNTHITGSAVSSSATSISKVFSGGVMSGSAQTAANLPTGTVSASMGVSGSSTSTGSFGKLLGEGGDITGLTAPAITAIASAGANQILTDDGDATVTSEANLTFDGTDLTVEAGDIIFGTAGKGICLGVTSNTDANTLDDYEEGLHIATLTCASGGGYSLHGDVDTLRYTKIGRLVTVQGYVIATAEDGTPSGNLRLSVPFANSPTTEASALLGGTLRFIGHATTHAGAPACQISGSAAYLVFAMTNDDGTEEYMDNDDVDTTIQSFHLVVNITYMAAT